MICDYEGSDYKTRFWVNADRAYEDAVERVALRRLLPPRGKRLIDIGAGFGRLADLYAGYDEVILLDYSRTMLRQAMEKWGHDPRFRFIAADVYHLPLAAGVISTAVMVRVIHHMADAPAALAEINRVIVPQGTLVLEFANKRNLKAVVRHALGRQAWSPHDRQPVEFAALNFDFHPQWMHEQLRMAGFNPRASLAVSYMRAALLKRLMPVQWMVFTDALLQRTAALGLWSPSVFTQNLQSADRYSVDNQALKGVALLRSPRSGLPLRREGDVLVCDADGTRWGAEGSFYDLKEPL